MATTHRHVPKPQTSIKLRPNAAAWLTLARLDRTEHQLPAAREDVSHALEVEPRQLRRPRPAAVAHTSASPHRPPTPRQNHESSFALAGLALLLLLAAVRRPRTGREAGGRRPPHLRTPSSPSARTTSTARSTTPPTSRPTRC